MFAALTAVSPTLTALLAALAGLAGLALAALAPIIAKRIIRSDAPAVQRQEAPGVVWWLALFIGECLASALLFTAAHAFGVTPALETTGKLALIAGAGVVLTAALGLLARLSARRA